MPTSRPSSGAQRGSTNWHRVVDDEPETRDLLRYVLKQCNTRVSEAAGATEALGQLSLGGIDLLVSDIGMPEIDGYEFIRRVRTLGDEGARIPAIALTAYARTEDRTQALRAGFDMHLTKPVEPSELRRGSKSETYIRCARELEEDEVKAECRRVWTRVARNVASRSRPLFDGCRAAQALTLPVKAPVHRRLLCGSPPTTRRPFAMTTKQRGDRVRCIPIM
jgi:CheY-like chemotaxis protein